MPNRILEYYQFVRGEKIELADCVAVVTPFATQTGKN
jgi:hypothetical protein